MAAPTISLAAAVNPVAFGGSTMVTPSFTGGTGSVDQGIGAVTSGTPFSTGILTTPKTYTLSVTNLAGTTATSSLTVTVQTVAVGAIAPASPVLTVGATKARKDGLGSAFIGGAGLLQFVLAYSVTLIAAYLLLGMNGIFCAVLLYLLTWGIKSWSQKRLGGITGDVIGCASELNEIICLMVLLALFRHGLPVF